MYFCAVNLPYLNPEAINSFIDAALKEDVGDGDHSSLAAIPEDRVNSAKLLVKDEGIIAGLELARLIFNRLDPKLDVTVSLKDGDKVQYGDSGLVVRGSSRSILTAERLVLNCMQRMSGIATSTHKLNELIKHTKTRLLDTRKTTPNARLIEKWAVAIGGGTNHRFGLYDMIMLKDNHIDYAGGISEAISRCRKYLESAGKVLKIEVETRNLQEVREVLAVGGVDVIMLDNMSLSELEEAIGLIDGRFLTEASGGITEKTIRAVAECGVDYISVGALTHSVQSLDISLKAWE